METQKIGLSREMIIHPGETLKEIIEDREISQKELALRTGFSQKHISTIINGEKNISADFALKLEYALGIEASFWQNLQSKYDIEIAQFNSINSISQEEISFAKSLIPIVNCLTEKNIIHKIIDNIDLVNTLRKLFKVNDVRMVSSFGY